MVVANFHDSFSCSFRQAVEFTKIPVATSVSSLLNVKRIAAIHSNSPLFGLKKKNPLQMNAHVKNHVTSPTSHDIVSSDFLELAHQLADAAAKVTLQYFRKRIEILDKDDLSPVTIADQAAERAMRTLISQRFPSHAIYGEEWGLEASSDDYEYVWVLDPIDGTKSFITGKPVFGTLIALVHKGIPVLGVIDQPVLKERWVGISDRRTVLNGQDIETRPCSSLSSAYLYTTSPHLFSAAAAEAFARVREKVKVPLYGCDCYAYGLLSAGHVDLVIEHGLKPYDFLALVPVVKGAGGRITNWKGDDLRWWPTAECIDEGVDIIAAGDPMVHEAALSSLRIT